MEKKMEPLEVKTTTDGAIDIIQGFYGPGDEDAHVVRITPDQVETLVKWLKEAKAELVGGSRPSPSVKPGKLSGV